MLWRILAGFLALLLTTSATAGGALLRCSMTGELSKSCCCDHEQADARDLGPALERDRSCCHVETTFAMDLPATAPSSGWSGLPAFTFVSEAFALPAPLPPYDHEAPGFVRARGPPLPAGPRLFLRNCSFLI